MKKVEHFYRIVTGHHKHAVIEHVAAAPVMKDRDK